MYYDYNNLFSHNALFNFIIGERGVGKTYGIMKKAIKDFIKTMNDKVEYDESGNKISGPSQFVYLRRYKTELKKFNTLLDPLVFNNEFKGHTIKINGDKVYVDKKLAGYGFAISNAVVLKSSTFPLVDKIIFDEFIIDKGNITYLSNEVDKFLETYETIARMRNVKVYFLGNAISIANPYFDYWNLTIPYNTDIKKFKDGLILVNYIKNEEYREAKKRTLFGKILEGTHYSEYAIDNQFLRDNDNLIAKKTGQCTSYCNLIIDGKTYGVWKAESAYYVSLDFDPNCKYVFALSSNDHTELTRLVDGSSDIIKILRLYYRYGKVFFESIQIKSKVSAILG